MVAKQTGYYISEREQPMPFQAMPLSAIPKRKAPERTFDQETADALLAIVSAPIPEGGSAPTATDGTAYADTKSARAEANKAKRLLSHVAPDGQIVKTAIFGLDAEGNTVLASDKAAKGFGFAVYLAPAPAEKAAAPAAETPKAGKK